MRLFVRKLCVVEIEMEKLQLGAIQTGPRGNKSAPLLSGNKPVTCKLPATSTPFNAGVFGDQPGCTRLNLDLHCDQEAYQRFLTEIDEFVIKTLQSNPETYFRKKLSPEEVRAAFKPSITQKNEWLPVVRTKINIGPNAIRVWDENKTLRALPEDWRRCSIEPILIAKSVYFMGPSCGVTYQIDDCIISEKSDECPF